MKAYFSVAILLILCGSCSSNDDGTSDQTDFCNHDRELVKEINTQNGELIFLEVQNKYAIRYYPVTPTIDEVTYYVLCQQPTGIEVDNQVTFSGEVYAFNEDEDFEPQVEGITFYYLKVDNLAKIE